MIEVALCCDSVNMVKLPCNRSRMLGRVQAFRQTEAPLSRQAGACQ